MLYRKPKPTVPRPVGIREIKIFAIHEEVIPYGCVLDNPAKTVEVIRPIVENHPYFDPEREVFFCFYLSTRRHLKSWQLISHGSLDTLLVHPREVFKGAIIDSASGIIIAHNHPSGDATPSESDVRITRDLIRAGQLLKIDLVDSIVLGKQTADNKGWCSLRELGYFYS